MKSTRNLPTRSRYSWLLAVSFFDVPGKIVLQRIQPPADVSPLILTERAQLPARLIFDLQAVTHSSYFPLPF
ncbi:hypothetical protein BH20VER3_BH20VER3_13500 [soil metagenome]